MINQKHKMKKSILVGSLFAGLLFSAAACGNKNTEVKVKDMELITKADNLYETFKKIANYEYKRIKGISDDVDYMKGMSSANCDLYDSSCGFMCVMYTDTEAISLNISKTDGPTSNEEELYNYFINLDYTNSANGIESYIGTIYNDVEFYNYAINKYTSTPEQTPDYPEYYIDNRKPYSYLAFQLQDGRVSLSMTGTSGAGCYLSVQDWIHNLDPIDTSRTGNGESVKKDRQPITYAMIEKYIKLN